MSHLLRCPFYDRSASRARLPLRCGIFAVLHADRPDARRALAHCDQALPRGTKRRLLVAKALVHHPPVLFLDEPTAGVDVELRRDLWAYVRKLSGQGTTIVLTTHYLEEAEELADRIGVIKNGRLLVVEDKQTLLSRYGKRTVRLRLEAPVREIPRPLLAAGAELQDGGRSLVLSAPPGESLGAS